MGSSGRSGHCRESLLNGRARNHGRESCAGYEVHSGARVREHQGAQVAASIAISRSSLEKRFTSVLGYTIRTAIKRAQLERTRRLVLETDLPLKQIAAQTGFRSVQHMTTLYVCALGVTPARHRRHPASDSNWLPSSTAFCRSKARRTTARVNGRQVSRETIVPLAFRTALRPLSQPPSNRTVAWAGTGRLPRPSHETNRKRPC